MSIKLKPVYILLLLGYGSVYSFTLFGGTSDENAICCIPDEWEGHIFGEEGAIFLGHEIYSNGTVYVVYSLTDKKVYYRYHIVVQTTEVSPTASNSTEYDDYEAGMSYSVGPDGECEKVQLRQEIPKQCIPSDAILLSSGVFGTENTPIETYHFVNTEGDNTTATVYITDVPVTPRQCQPIQFTLTLSVPPYTPKTIANLNVMDIGPIKSKDVFNVPDACK